MKISAQDKIAELEQRIAALEKRQQPVDAVSRTTLTRVSLEPEMGRIWASMDALFAKVFK